MRRTLSTALAALLAFGCAASPAAATSRIKDLASIEGVRQNQLIGYGLVVGLDGSGDQTAQAPFTAQGLNTMLQQLGINALDELPLISPLLSDGQDGFDVDAS